MEMKPRCGARILYAALHSVDGTLVDAYIEEYAARAVSLTALRKNVARLSAAELGSHARAAIQLGIEARGLVSV
jgi:hypothetical protein